MARNGSRKQRTKKGNKKAQGKAETQAIATRPAKKVRNTSFVRLLESILLDRPLTGVRYPAFGYSGRYSEQVSTARFTLVNGAAVQSSFVMNPVLSAVDGLWTERITGGAQQWQYVPTALMNSTTTPADSLPTSSAFTQISFSNTFSSGITQGAASPTAGYSGWIRVKFVEVTSIYTGTELNQGGTQATYHNPSSHALLNYQDGSGANLPTFAPSYTSVNAMIADTENCSLQHFGKVRTVHYFPPKYEFVSFQTRFGATQNAAGTLNQVNQRVEEYLPENEEARVVAPKGWNFGIVWSPAAGTAATTGAIQVIVRTHYDVVMSRIDTTSLQTTSLIPGNVIAHTHPAQEAALRNVNGMLHGIRSSGQLSHHADNLGFTARDASRIARQAAAETGADVLVSAASAIGGAIL